MSDSMRGTRLGFFTYETDAHVVPPARQFISYECPAGHHTTVPYSVEAEEIPYEWTCRCGRVAVRPDMGKPEGKSERYVRTHWDMLLERRTIPELEALLAERLGLLRAVDPSEALPRSA